MTKRWKCSDISDEAVCAAYAYRAKYRYLGEFATDVLSAMFPGCPDKVIERATERALKHKFIEYGVSLRSGWLTDAGKALVNNNKQQLATSDNT